MNIKLFMHTCLTLFIGLLVTGTVHSASPSEPGMSGNSEQAMSAVSDAIDEEEDIESVKSSRPNKEEGPTPVTFSIFVLDIDAIDAATQNFTVNVFVKLSWQDPRLATKTRREKVRSLPLSDIWHPQVLITNRQGILQLTFPTVANVDADGNVTYRQRYTGALSQPLNLSEFPMDSHIFTIQFAAATNKPDELEFIPERFEFPGSEEIIIGGAMAEKLSVPDWKITDYEAVEQPYQPLKFIKNAGFAFNFTAERTYIYFYWQIMLPLIVVVVMSWTAFWVRHQQEGVRVSVATSSILTLIAHRFIVASLLPRLAYMTKIDYFSVGSTLLVFLALILVVVSNRLHARGYEIAAERIDHVARIAYPVIFITLLSWFIFF